MAGYICPNDQKPLRERKGPHGMFWGCSGYPDCKYTWNGDDNVPEATKNAQNAPQSLREPAGGMTVGAILAEILTEVQNIKGILAADAMEQMGEGREKVNKGFSAAEPPIIEDDDDLIPPPEFS